MQTSATVNSFRIWRRTTSLCRSSGTVWRLPPQVKTDIRRDVPHKQRQGNHWCSCWWWKTKAATSPNCLMAFWKRPGWFCHFTSIVETTSAHLITVGLARSTRTISGLRIFSIRSLLNDRYSRCLQVSVGSFLKSRLKFLIWIFKDLITVYLKVLHPQSLYWRIWQHEPQKSQQLYPRWLRPSHTLQIWSHWLLCPFIIVTTSKNNLLLYLLHTYSLFIRFLLQCFQVCVHKMTYNDL